MRLSDQQCCSAFSSKITYDPVDWIFFARQQGTSDTLGLMFSLRSAPPPPSLWEELELRASYLQFKVKAAKVANPSKTSQTNNTCVYNTNHAMSMMNNDVNESLGVSLSAGGLPF